MRLPPRKIKSADKKSKPGQPTHKPAVRPPEQPREQGAKAYEQHQQHLKNLLHKAEVTIEAQAKELKLETERADRNALLAETALSPLATKLLFGGLAISFVLNIILAIGAL
jgi:hypothetical protein